MAARARKETIVRAGCRRNAGSLCSQAYTASLDARITGWLYEPGTNRILSGVVRSRKIYTCGCDLRYFPAITFSCNSAIGTRARTSLVRSRTASPAFATRRSRQTAFRGNLARDRQGTSAEFRRDNAFWKWTKDEKPIHLTASPARGDE